MAAVRAGLVEFLAACEPNPALVLHGPFDIVMTNRPTQTLLTGVAPDLLRPPVNLMRLALHPRGLAPRIVNLPQWREHLLNTLRRSMIAGGPSALHALYEEVSGYPVPVPVAVASPGPDPDSWREAGTRANGTGPPAPPGSHSAPALALPLCLRVDDRVLTFLSTMTTFNAPTDVTVSELAIELFLPADATTTRTITELVARTDDSTPGSQPRS